MESLSLTPQQAKQLLAEAAARGVTVETLLESIINDSGKATDNGDASAAAETGQGHFQRSASPDEWAQALREWAGGHTAPPPPLTDYAVSRESIYTREDEML